MALREALGVAPDALLVGMIARFDPVKRHDLFLAAVAAAARSGLDVHAVLAGTGVTAANPALARLVDGGDLGRRVHLLGERQDVERIMPALDVLVSASGWAEGFPNVVGEAMACGVPCLVTDTGDSAAIVGDGGVVVPPGDGGRLQTASSRPARLPHAAIAPRSAHAAPAHRDGASRSPAARPLRGPLRGARAEPFAARRSGA